MKFRRLISMTALAGLTACASFGQTESQAPAAPGTNPPGSAQAVQALTLADAQKIAVQNHPQIQAATFEAAVASAETQAARSAYYPQVYGSLTGAVAEHNSRIAAGGLNNPIVFDRFASGVAVGQLITDFGRTHQLVKSSNLHARAEQENVVTTRADVLLQVTQAYFGVLKSQALLRVAQETVNARQTVADQVGALAKQQLRSGLDVSFANVDLAQAQLLLIQAQNDVQSSMAQLSVALGYPELRTFQLAEEPLPVAPPADIATLLQEAKQDRPELIRQRLEVNSGESFATAERDLWFPTIAAVGAAGLVPVNQAEQTPPPRYAAAGFNVNIPLFNGHLFGALHSEAENRARVQERTLQDLENRIARDVRTAWLNAGSAYQRLSVTEQLLGQSRQALDLAQERYKLGLSSIVELSQAQLNLTQAEITEASAKYDFQTQSIVLTYELGHLR
jgi:outer membrane protein